MGCKEELNVGTLKVPAKYLSHSTHNESASGIIEQNQYLFIPQEKKGKDYSCSTSQAHAKNGSYRFNKRTKKFKKISASKPMLPGHLIWWGINVSEWYKDDGRAIGQAIERMQHQGVYTAQYLANPPGSKYGSNVFTIKFHDLLECYRNSRRSRNIVFRMGGTLRYREEICYVFLISGFHPEGGRGGSFPPPPPKIWDSCIEKYIKPHPFPGASPRNDSLWMKP